MSVIRHMDRSQHVCTWLNWWRSQGKKECHATRNVVFSQRAILVIFVVFHRQTPPKTVYYLILPNRQFIIPFALGYVGEGTQREPTDNETLSDDITVSDFLKGALLIITLLRLLATMRRRNIVTCRGARIMKITGSGSDDWIYWHFGYKLS
jgi:hypothetical protein